MRRRDFSAYLSGAMVAWPLVARAQQRALPAIGFLRSTPANAFEHYVVGLREGLKEHGFVEGTNVAIEYRFADNHQERLPALVAELIRREVSVIIGNSPAADAAKAATTTVPIIFVIGDDPIAHGLVASLNRPGGNITGITFFGGGKLAAKRLELLQELVPNAKVVAVLLDPTYAGAKAEFPDLQAAAHTLGLNVIRFEVASERDLEPAVSAIAKSGADAVVVGGSPFIASQRQALVALVARHRLPSIHDIRDHAEAGGLISYSASVVDAYRLAGTYAALILKGAKPADLPVLQPSKFELTVNLKTAKALGIAVPQSILVRADEVIE